MRRILLITFLTYFVSSGLGIAVPLALLERNVSLTEIGIVLSILPIVFLTVRVLFAAIADQLGWSPLFMVNTISSTIATTIYLFSKSPMEFAIGKIFEGISISAYWAISRTATYMLSPNRETSEATRVIATTSIGGATGGAIIGLLMSKIGLSAAFTTLIFASIIQIYPTILLWRTGLTGNKLRLLKALKALDPRNRGWEFWYVSLIMAINSLSRYPLFSLVMPIFMAKELGYDYMTIGFINMIYLLTSSITIYSTLKMPLNIGRAIIQSIIYLLVCIALMEYKWFLPILMIMLAFSEGLSAKFYENIIAKVSKDRRETLSIDIGILHIPMRIFESSSLIIFGLIIENYGYNIVFIISGIAYIIFSTLSYMESREK
ncbi:MAG: MFS transporter [Candidatus Methanomethylicia archaeon]